MRITQTKVFKEFETTCLDVLVEGKKPSAELARSGMLIVRRMRDFENNLRRQKPKLNGV